MRGWVGFAAANGFIGVLAGAMGAHVLAGRIGAKGLEWLGTAERYQMWHALALLAVAVLARAGEAGTGRRWLRAAAAAFAAGIVLFSGSLYVLAFTGWRPVAMLTPVGGLAFMAGWVALAGHAVFGRAR
ncbi:MAG: DUF423 domain-containing protein [Alphaproteobacteria bacterium]|nr:DUF423 domain-containing protein [Alphaproteobacteria bacterium]